MSFRRRGLTRTRGAGIRVLLVSLLTAVFVGCASGPTRKEVFTDRSAAVRRAQSIDALLIEDRDSYSFENRTWSRDQLQKERERLRTEIDGHDEKYEQLKAEEEDA